MCGMVQPWTDTATDFFANLGQRNDRDWWQANRATYDMVIKSRFEELISGISGFDTWRVYRPHNDSRFQRGKGPYKTFIGAVSERPDGVGVFVQINAQGLLVGTGIPMPAPDQLQRMRSALAEPEAGDAFEVAIGHVRASGGRVFGGRWEPLRRVPRGHPIDHLIACGDPLHVWLAHHVGPSALTAEERFAPKPRRLPSTRHLVIDADDPKRC